MEITQIVFEGASDSEIQKNIERMTKGWRLFFVEPTGSKYQFIQPFWGFPWNGTSENLKKIILRGAKVKDKVKQHICVFKYNGTNRFAWCSWTKEVYDFDTKKYYQLEGDKMSMKITSIINNIMRDPDVEDIY